MRLALACVLAATPVSAQSVNEILHGSYAPDGNCGTETAAIVGPEGVELLAGGENMLVEAWTLCTNCKANALQPGLLAIASPEGDSAPTLRFEAMDSQVVLIVEGGEGPIAETLAAESPLPRCIDSP